MRSAAKPNARSGNCQTTVENSRYSPSPNHNAKTMSASPGNQSQIASSINRDILHEEQKFPPRIHVRILAPGRQKNIDREDDKIDWHDPQGAAGKETFEIDRLIACKWREQLPAD